MSSQIAMMTGPGGLPSSPSPGPDLDHPAQSTWPDHMDADQPTDNAVPLPQDTIIRERTTSSSQENRTAPVNGNKLGNLLDALRKSSGALKVSRASQPGELPVYPGASITAPVNGMNLQEQAGPSDNDNGHAATNGQGFTNNQYPLNSSFDSSPFPPMPYAADQNMGLTMNGLPHPERSQPAPSIQDRREVEAFAKIEFEDGNYYITTWQCELGRDALAYRDAIERAEEVKNDPVRAQSSSGRISRPSDRVRRHEDSHMQGSVISEAGGFGGIDEAPREDDPLPDGNGHPSHSSQLSASDVVRPQEVLYHPPTVPFDYHRNAEMQARILDPDWEQPAPVTAEHMPDADQCPIIPIHAMATLEDELATHKSISRRHVRIEWDFETECFKLRVLGRNGAFVDGEYLKKGSSKRLTSGSRIQIAAIWLTFRLPRPKTEPLSDESGDEMEDDALNRRSTSPTSNESLETPDAQQKPKLTLHNSATPVHPTPVLGPDGQPILRKRGPGRPPKNGVMSLREQRERSRAAQAAQLKAENGGKTPPPMAMTKGKPTKLFTREELAKAESKPEKRKYNKRKREAGDGDVLPSIEVGEEDIDSNDERSPNKKARASKSPSPEYPPYGSLTEEQLQRPNEPYAKVIYDLLLEIHPKAVPLKGVYRMIKMRYPFYVYRVDSDGWQSSVRHNLNQEWNKLFEKGEKEGKGYAWRAIPGAIHPQQERKRAAPTAPAAKPKPPPPRNPPQPQPQQSQHPQQTQHPQHPQQPVQWPSNQAYPPQYYPPAQQGPYPPPPNGVSYPGSTHHPPPGYQMPGPNGFTSQQRPSSSQTSTPQPPSNYPPSQHRPPFPGFLQQAPAPPPSNPGTAAPNMPCTLEGIMAIRRFEDFMYEQIRMGSNPQSLEYWQQVFTSVKKRLLHGQLGSTMPSGETQEELIIMGYLRPIRDRFRNVNFVGFGERRGTPVPAGGPVLPVGSTAGDVVQPGLGTVGNGDGQAEANALPSAEANIGAPTLAPTNDHGEMSRTASLGSDPNDAPINGNQESTAQAQSQTPPAQASRSDA